MPERNGMGVKNLKKQMIAGGVDPSMVQLWGEQAFGLQRSYGESKALLKLQRGQLKSQFQHQKSAIYQQRVFDMQSAAGAAAERGVLGSSSDASARSQVRAGATSQVIAARDAKRQGLTANLSQIYGVNSDFRSGLIQLKAQAAAQTAASMSAQEQQDFYGDLNDMGSASNDKGTGPRGGSSGATNPDGSPNPGMYGTDNQHLRDFSKPDIRALSNAQQSKYQLRANEVLRRKLAARRENLGANERIVWKNGRYVKQTNVAAGGPSGSLGTQAWNTDKALKSLSKLRRLRNYASAQYNPGEPA